MNSPKVLGSVLDLGSLSCCKLVLKSTNALSIYLHIVEINNYMAKFFKPIMKSGRDKVKALF